MCGRFTLVRLADFLGEFPWILPPLFVPAGGGDGRYNIAPTQPVAAVMAGPQPRAEFVQWGLVPSWANDPTGGGKMINARAETLAERPAYGRLVARQRCLIPADGFYEWRTDGRRKTPHYVRLRSGRPFALAGLWDQWHDPGSGQVLKTCTIITTEPNGLIATLHTRMAVMVRPADVQPWLSAAPLPPDRLAAVLSPYPAGEMEAFPVGPAVSNVRSDGPGLIEPAPAAVDEPLLF